MVGQIGKNLFIFTLLAAGGWIALNAAMGEQGEMGRRVVEAFLGIVLGFILRQVLTGKPYS